MSMTVLPTNPAPAKLVFSCSGAADVAEIADRAARQLHRGGCAKMFCLAGVGGHVPDIVERTRSAAKIVVIDGCEKDCGKECMRGAGITNFAHLRVTDLGMTKGQTPATDQHIDRVAQCAAAALA